MVLYAAKRIDDAVSLTRSLLFPFSALLWLKLAVVTFFVGSGGAPSVTNFQSFSGGGPGGDFDPGTVQTPENLLLIVAVIVVIALAIGLLFGLVGAIMEFIFVAGLRDQEVHIRRGFRRYFWPGARLLGFRLALTLGMVLLVGGVATALFWPELSALLAGDPVGFDASIFFRVLPVIGIALVLALPLALVQGFTAEFVVPIMLKKGCGVVDGWRRLWGTMRGQLKQYAVYVLVSFGLRIATGIIAGILAFIIALVVFIPFGIVGFAIGVAAFSGDASIVGIVALVLLVLVGIVVFVALISLVTVPIVAFHRYFALLFVGDTNAEFDVLGELRPPLEDETAGGASA